MTSQTGYIFISEKYVPNLRLEDLELGFPGFGIQLKMGYGTPDERLNQINRLSQVKFIKLCENMFAEKKDEKFFRHCFQQMFNLESRENSHNEFHISTRHMTEMNVKFSFGVVFDASLYNFCRDVAKCMVEKAKEFYIVEEQKVSRKRGRPVDDDKWLQQCEDFKIFVELFKYKPQTKNHQLISKRHEVNYHEAKLGNWYNNQKQQQHLLTSIRREKFDELEEYISGEFYQ